MDDFDNLNSKTDSDLRQIAVAFGDFTAEEAEKKTRDELLMAITGAKDIGDITTVDLTEEPVPVKAPAIPEPMKTTENTKSLDELIVDVGRTARFETNELADAMLKAEKEEEKKVAKKEAVAEGLTEEPKAEKKTADKSKKTKEILARQGIHLVSTALGVITNTVFVAIFTLIFFNGTTLGNTIINVEYILAWFGLNFAIEVVAFSLITPPITLAIKSAKLV